MSAAVRWNRMQRARISKRLMCADTARPAGQEECERCCSELEDESQRIARKRQYNGVEGATKLLPMPLYAALPATAQLRAFEAAPRGFRKVCSTSD